MTAAARFPLLDPHTAGLVDAMAKAGNTPMVELPVSDARAVIAATAGTCAPGPELRTVEEVELAPHFGGRLYTPDVVRGEGAVVYFHGGGWVTGDLEYADATCRLIADASAMPVLSVDYRLAPEAPFPAAVEDVLDAVDWAARRWDRLVLMGDSAGGNLAAVCAQRLRADERIAGTVLVYPVVDGDLDRPSYVENSDILIGRREMAWFIDHYCPDPADRVDASFAPIRAADLSGLAPTEVFVGGHDPLRDEGLDYAARLTAAGVDVRLHHLEPLAHGFLQFTAIIPAAVAAAREVAAAPARIMETHHA
ncbi:alpha/beta hydrolase [Tomitella biformata]|uniref:alpha/beta hydrolase n=1 Tax=Tomitella biformata TaxID=630403 RepID=UPI000463075F|nr:alpha/beta hydrolase [Tomitella biformata]